MPQCIATSCSAEWTRCIPMFQRFQRKWLMVTQQEWQRDCEPFYKYWGNNTDKQLKHWQCWTEKYSLTDPESSVVSSCFVLRPPAPYVPTTRWPHHRDGRQSLRAVEHYDFSYCITITENLWRITWCWFAEKIHSNCVLATLLAVIVCWCLRFSSLFGLCCSFVYSKGQTSWPKVPTMHQCTLFSFALQ